MSRPPQFDPLTSTEPEPRPESRLLWSPNDWPDERELWVEQDHGGHPEDAMNHTRPLDVDRRNKT